MPAAFRIIGILLFITEKGVAPHRVSMADMGEDRYFPNTYPKHIKDDKEHVMNSAKTGLSEAFQSKAKENLKVLQKILDVGVAKGDQRDDYSVYTGTCGYALLYLHLAEAGVNDFYLQKASVIVNNALRHLKGRRPSFLCGDPGPLALAAILAQKDDKPDLVEEYIARIKGMGKDVLDWHSGLPDEILYGRAGYLYSLLFLQHKIGNKAIQDTYIRDVVVAILKSGQSLAKKEKSTAPLMYKWHDKKYLGAAHGLAGIIFMLLQAVDQVTQDELDTLIRPTVDYLVSQMFPSGNFPSSLGNSKDRLVQWCHGAPGAIFLFCKAYQVFGNKSYLEEAERCGRCVWERGILKKGYGICHGTAGNGYALLHLYQVTGNPEYLFQAAQFGLWCHDYGTHNVSKPDRPLSLYEGLAGTVYFLSDLTNPKEAHFPAFGL